MKYKKNPIWTIVTNNKSKMIFFPYYKAVDASQYLVITGAFIKDVSIKRKSWLMPGQRYRIIDVTPENYDFTIEAFSKEMLPFALPVVFTIGPEIDHDSLQLFAKTLGSNHDLNSDHVRVVIRGIIEGETRVLASALTVDQIFKGVKIHFIKQN